MQCVDCNKPSELMNLAGEQLCRVCNSTRYWRTTSRERAYQSLSQLTAQQIADELNRTNEAIPYIVDRFGATVDDAGTRIHTTPAITQLPDLSWAVRAEVR